jgi:hypothetical protein
VLQEAGVNLDAGKPLQSTRARIANRMNCKDVNRARGYRQKDAGTGTRTGKWRNAGTVPFVPGVLV